MSKAKPLARAICAINLGLMTFSFQHLAFAQGDENLEEVHVTGSRIRQANLVSTAPITQIDAEEIRFQGVVRVEDMLRNVPQIYSSQNSGQSNGATGTATINLRNLGEERTLVLVNGRRLPAGSPLQGGIGSDINQIPANLIKRAEVLTGGASAIYGSDAVAGVVNFQMVDDFEGVEIDFQRSIYRHNNDSSRWRGIVEESGYPAPSGATSDGGINALSIVLGGNFADDRGNATTYATYRKVEPVLQANRDYSACALSNESDACFGSGTIPQGRITDFGLAGGFDFIVQDDEFVQRNGETFNYGALNYFMRPDERVTIGGFSHYEINPNVEVYGEFMYMDDRSVAQIAPSGAFFVTDTLECGNPLMSEQQFQTLCGQFGLTREDTQTAFIGRRNVEGGNRQHDLRHTSHRIATGFRGEISDVWSYDIYYQYSEVSMENTYLNDLSTTKIRRALDAVENEEGDIVCRSVVDGSDPNCVPWNVFQTGAVTQEMIDYLVLPLFARGTTKQRIFSGHLTADLESYGIKLPTADTAIGFAFGFENRLESLDFVPDEGFRSGEGAGQGGATPPVNGEYTVKDIFAEVSIPLVEGVTGVQALNADIAIRRSEYDQPDVTADAFGLGLGWEINNSVKLRASYQEAVRGANIRELYRPEGLNLADWAADPCGGPIGENGLTAEGRSFEECARSGVTEAQWGSIPNNDAGQYNFLEGGNTNLKPEQAETITLGVVFTPSFIDGLSITVDYYDIEITDGIDNYQSLTVLNQCLDGAEEFCSNVKRGAAGDLWVGSNVETSGYVTTYLQNLSVETAKGYDLIIDYDFSIGELGEIAVNNVASYISEFNKAEFDGATPCELRRKMGNLCNQR